MLYATKEGVISWIDYSFNVNGWYSTPLKKQYAPIIITVATFDIVCKKF